MSGLLYAPSQNTFALLGLQSNNAQIATVLSPNALVSTDANSNLESATVLSPNLSFTANQLALNVNLILKSIAGSGGVLDISTTLTMSSNSTINAGDVLPTANNTYSLGDNAYQWLNANIGNVYVATQLVLPGTGTIQYLSVYELQNYSPYSQILMSTNLVPTIDNAFYLGSQFFAYNTIYVNNIHSQGTIAINNTLSITGDLNPNSGSMYNMGGNGYSWNNIWGAEFIGGSFTIGGVTPGSLCYITSATSQLDSASVAAPLVFSGSTLSLSTSGGFGNILPAADITYTLGNSTSRWLSLDVEDVNVDGTSSTTSGSVNFVSSTNVVLNAIAVVGTFLGTNYGTVIDDGTGQVICNNLKDSGLSGTANIVFGNASQQLTSTIPGICVVHTIQPFAASTNDCGTTGNPWLNVCSNGLVAIGTSVNSSGSVLFLNSAPTTKASLQWNNGVGLETNNGNILDDGSSNSTVRGNQTVLGGVTCGTLDVQGAVSALSTDLIPSAPFMYKLGSSTDYWQYVYCTLCQLCDAVGNICGLCTQTNIGSSYSLAFPGPWGSSSHPAQMQTEFYGLQQVVTYVGQNVQQGTSATFVNVNAGSSGTLITVSFTPLRSTSTVRISVCTSATCSVAGAGNISVFRGATNCAFALNSGTTAFQYVSTPSSITPVSFTFVDAPATTSAISYTLQVYSSGSGGSTVALGNTGLCSVLLCEEIFS